MDILSLEDFPASVVQMIEKRMRPGFLSEEGFLGEKEGLAEIVQLDRDLLCQAGYSCKELALRLKHVADKSQEIASQSSASPKNGLFYRLWNKLFTSGTVGSDVCQKVLPPKATEGTGDDIFDHICNRYRVDNLEVSFLCSAGLQSCPFLYSSGLPCSHTVDGDIDYKVYNPNSGKSFTFGGLLIHLIDEHGFFEGKASPYRLEPTDVIEVLGISPNF